MRGISRTTWVIIGVIIVVIIAIGAYYYIKAVTTPKTVTLVVVAYSGTTAQFIQFAGQLFHEEHPNVYVKVITYPFSQYVTNELTALEAHSTEYDIIEFTSTSALRFVPYVLPLNPYVGTLFNMSDLMTPQEPLAVSSIILQLGRLSILV
ncbi:extracellular solute-binding protein [Vulcanisaeta sp. JCM 16161]|uniref:extracellular solute-binding protein n=1 Tax=Vulcanisaeta sp. JCM 16161 TaxID=1295372 RepID=UPI000A4098A9|nr:extracellular solute-binding protein [Vulcanisaeta sp. JCM 16161]